MRNIERALTRVEGAGGVMSEAIQLIQELPNMAVISNKMVSVNIALGDVRRALVMVEQGGDPVEIARELERLLRDAFE